MKAAEFDSRFDDGEDMGEHVDWSAARRPNIDARRVSIDVPAWVVDGLDRQAERLGVSREALIKLWTAERLGSVLT